MPYYGERWEKKPPALSIRATQITDDILKAASSEELTEFSGRTGRPLSRKTVVDAVQMGFYSQQITVMGRKGGPPLDSPVKVMYFDYHANSNTNVVKNQLGLVFEVTFFENCTPDLISQYVHEGIICP